LREKGYNGPFPFIGEITLGIRRLRGLLAALPIDQGTPPVKMPKYDKLPEKSILRKWEAIRALDRIAIPLIPQVGLDLAYRRALQSAPCKSAPRAAAEKEQGSLFR
jgi:hypothetical protein